MRIVSLPTIAITVWVAALTVAGVAAQKTEAEQYLPKGAVVAEKLIPAPPAVGSPAFEEELTVVLQKQQERSPEEVAFVERKLDFSRFAEVLGEDLAAVDTARLEGLLDKAIDHVRSDYDAVKGRYDYPRPHQVSGLVEPVGEARPVASYPSGHSIRATVYARLLSEVFPDRASELADLGERIGKGRVVAGQHYPMDVTSGQILGHAYSDAIIRQLAFRSAISEIRKAGV